MSYMDKETMRYVDESERDKFSKLADEWWNQKGAFKTLHIINPIRVAYIQDMTQKHLNQPLNQLKILDIGCGGGLICEALARLGANITGVDASGPSIAAAKIHAEQSNLNIDYQCVDIYDMQHDYKDYFDIVLNCEVVEHVRDPESFMQTSANMLKPQGIMIAATLNRTIEAYLKAIIGAEYILGWLPRGTHDWHKFLTPAELTEFLRPCGLNLQDCIGLVYNPLMRQWSLQPKKLGVNYMLCLLKENNT